MAAGFVTIPIVDGAGATRNVRYWSDDGTGAGNLTPAPITDGSAATGVAPPVGGTGPLGWLSGIFSLLTGVLRVNLQGRTSKASATKLDGTSYAVATTAYAAGQVLGGPVRFAALLDAAATGVIQSIRARAMASAQTASIKLYLFHAAPTGTYADKATFAVTAADAANLFGPFTLVSPDPSSGATLWTLDGVGAAVVNAAGIADLWAIPVAGGAMTFASATDLGFSINMLKD